MINPQFDTVTLISVLFMVALALITARQFWRMAKDPKRFSELKKLKNRKKKSA